MRAQLVTAANAGRLSSLQSDVLGPAWLGSAFMKAPLLRKPDLGSRKQRLQLLMLCLLGILALLLGVPMVLPSLSPRVPKWYRAHYSAGRTFPRGAFAAQRGLHLTRTNLGSMRDDTLWLRGGSNVWFLEVVSPSN